MAKKRLSLIVLVIIFLFFSACSINQNKESSLYRFTDQLEEKNIIRSPLINLDQQFERVIQKWTGKDFRPLTVKRKKYLAISSQLPVLGWENQGKPKLMKIAVDGKEIPFQEDSSPNAYNWILKKGEFELNQFKTNGKKTQVLLLNEKETLRKQILLPEGEFILEIWAESENSLAYLPKLRINLNDEPMAEVVIGRYKSYKLAGQAKMGWNKLSLSFANSYLINEQTERRLYIDRILIKSLSDLLLFSRPKNKADFLASEFSAEYLAEPVAKIFKIEKDIQPSQTFLQEIEFDSPGKELMEIIGHSRSLDCRLNVKLNDQRIFQGKVTSPDQYILSLERFLGKGKFNLEIECLPGEQAGGSFYLSSIIIQSPFQEICLHLAKIRKLNLIPTLSISKNPLGLKKKFVVPNLSWRTSTTTAINSIFAPPATVLEFSLKIPQPGTLDFGYGLLEKTWKEKGQRVKFKITIQDKKKKEVIFSKNLNPYRKKSQRRLFHQRIDLSSYSNKKVKLRLITTSSSLERDPSNKKNLAGQEFAYWHNPVIYVPSGKEKARPDINIILVSLDTLRADHLHCYGYERETSPSMDCLGKEGTLFTNAFSSTSWTLPAHISLFTSLDNRNHQVHKINPRLDKSIITLANILRKNGYFTYGFTGGGLVSGRFGFSKGFDFYREFWGSKHRKDSAKLLFDHFDIWLKKNKDKKFFLFLHTYQTHEPYFSPLPFNSLFLDAKKTKWKKADMPSILFDDGSRHTKRFDALNSTEKENIIALYDGEIRYTDECLIKTLVERLKKLNLFQRTMIIVTSDHGEEFFNHEGWLHGHTLYNELTRIPLIIKFPFSQFKKIQSDEYVQITDIVPTILDAVGIDYSSYQFDGESLVPILKNDKKKERILVSDLGVQPDPSKLPAKIAINLGEFKLILNNKFGMPPEHFFPTAPPIAKVEFYDLTKDPLEKKNIAQQEKEMVQYLLKKIYELYPVGPEKKAPKEEIDKELEETLRALGYIR